MKLMLKSKEYLNVQRIVNFTLFISIGIALSIFDLLIPINLILPGAKLGLSNIILVLLLKHYNFKELFIFQFIKITITTFIVGLFSVYLFSLSGGFLALLVMYSLYKLFKEKVSIYTLSISGAIAHNIGQIIFAIFYLKSIELIFYIPFLVLYGSITGFILAYIIVNINPYVERKINENIY